MRRLNVALGRIGTALLALCLALAILTLIPPAKLGFSTKGKTTLKPRTYMSIGNSLNLNPQILLKIKLNTNATIKFYIINLPRIETELGNLTQFNKFMEENSDKVLLEETIGEENVVEYTPEGIVTVSFILLNENPHEVEATYEIEPFASIAPTVRIIPVITYLSPLGAIFTGQWILIKFKNRKKRI